ncbi:MAG: hypothetical protein HOJ95_08430, partial [Nitrospinaceae bacterium]|nr:hypothetical protein [Nitrospinaceae bacterium]
ARADASVAIAVAFAPSAAWALAISADRALCSCAMSEACEETNSSRAARRGARPFDAPLDDGAAWADAGTSRAAATKTAAAMDKIRFFKTTTSGWLMLLR